MKRGNVDNLKSCEKRRRKIIMSGTSACCISSCAASQKKIINVPPASPTMMMIKSNLCAFSILHKSDSGVTIAPNLSEINWLLLSPDILVAADSFAWAPFSPLVKTLHRVQSWFFPRLTFEETHSAPCSYPHVKVTIQRFETISHHSPHFRPVQLFHTEIFGDCQLRSFAFV